MRDAVKTTRPATPPPLRLREPPRQWVIWRLQGSRPKVRHTTLRAALDEVARLRKLCPSEVYTIYELVPLSRTMGSRR
jgi:hypothetical protein